MYECSVTLYKHRLNEKLSYYENAIDSAGSEELKAVVEADSDVRVLLVCRAIFEMSVDHLLDFISVDSAKLEHIDRCKDIVTVCEKAHEYDLDLREISDLIVDVTTLRVKLAYAWYSSCKIVTSDVTASNLVNERARNPRDGMCHQGVEQLHVSIQKNQRRRPCSAQCDGPENFSQRYLQRGENRAGAESHASAQRFMWGQLCVQRFVDGGQAARFMVLS